MESRLPSSLTLIQYGDSGLVYLRDRKKELSVVTRQIRQEASPIAEVYHLVHKNRRDLVDLLEDELTISSDINSVLRDMTQRCRSTRDNLADYVESKGRKIADYEARAVKTKEDLERLAKGENGNLSEFRRCIAQKDMEAELKRTAIVYGLSKSQASDSALLVSWLTDVANKFETVTRSVEEEVEHLQVNSEAYRAAITLGKASRIMREIIKNISNDASAVYTTVERAIAEIDSLFRNVRFPRLRTNGEIHRLLSAR